MIPLRPQFSSINLKTKPHKQTEMTFSLRSNILIFIYTMLYPLLQKFYTIELWKFSHIARSYFRNVGDFLFRKTLQELNHHLLSLQRILNVIFIDERCWFEQATSTKKSVCWWWCQGRYKSRLLHVINFWSYREVRSEAATGTSPTETLGGWGTLHQVNNSPCPEGSTNNNPSITKSRERKEGGKQGRERNNKHLFTVAVVTFSVIFFMIYDLLWEAWGELIGSGEFKKEALVMLRRQLWSSF